MLFSLPPSGHVVSLPPSGHVVSLPPSSHVVSLPPSGHVVPLEKKDGKSITFEATVGIAASGIGLCSIIIVLVS